jgi:hypothetical protein
MKRDWDLIRQVLLEVEELDTHTRDKKQYGIRYGERSDTDALAEHALLLYENGYLEAIDAGTMSGPGIVAPKLTWQGHELLDTMRSGPVWNRVKTIASDKGIELTFDAVKALAKIAFDAIISGQ